MSSFGKQWAHDHFGFVYSAKWLLLILFEGILLRQDAERSEVVFTKINLLNFGEPLGQKRKDNCLQNVEVLSLGEEEQ